MITVFNNLEDVYQVNKQVLEKLDTAMKAFVFSLVFFPFIELFFSLFSFFLCLFCAAIDVG